MTAVCLPAREHSEQPPMFLRRVLRECPLGVNQKSSVCSRFG